jgi:GTP-binding protein LepA
MNFESSAALGSGFRCGFLGMLHMDVFRQRLREEHGLAAIMTLPNVSYYCKVRGKPDLIRVDNPTEGPEEIQVEYYNEAIMKTSIVTPKEYVKGIKTLCDNRKALCTSETYTSGGKGVTMTYEVPLSEIITDFFDNLKSVSQGYASLDYEHSHW